MAPVVGTIIEDKELKCDEEGISETEDIPNNILWIGKICIDLSKVVRIEKEDTDYYQGFTSNDCSYCRAKSHGNWYYNKKNWDTGCKCEWSIRHDKPIAICNAKTKNGNCNWCKKEFSCTCKKVNTILTTEKYEKSDCLYSYYLEKFGTKIMSKINDIVESKYYVHLYLPEGKSFRYGDGTEGDRDEIIKRFIQTNKY